MKIRDVMKRGPLSVEASDTLLWARNSMAWLKLRHLPVLRDGKLVGVLSERDLLSYGARADSAEWLLSPVEQAMQRDPQTAAPGDSIHEAAGRMAASKIGCLPVTELGKLVGLVTSTDILSAQVFSALQPTPRSLATALDAMTPNPVSVHPSDRLLDAAARMQQHAIRHLLVVDAEGRLQGMLSDRDVRRAIGNPIEAFETGSRRVRIEATRVSDAMSRVVQTASADQPVSDLARYFAQHWVGALPVLDSQGKPIGIVSYVDVLRSMSS